MYMYIYTYIYIFCYFVIYQGMRNKKTLANTWRVMTKNMTKAYHQTLSRHIHKTLRRNQQDLTIYNYTEIEFEI